MNTVSFLHQEERTKLTKLVRTGYDGARVLGRASILLKLDKGVSPEDIACGILVSERTVYRIRDRYKSEGLKRSLYDLPRSGQPPKLNQKARSTFSASCLRATSNDCRYETD